MIHKILIVLFLLALPIISEGASLVSNGLKLDVGETTTSAGTLTLTRTSSQIQRFLGTSAHTLKLPDATTLLRGWWYEVSNDSSGTITVNDNGSNAVGSITAGNAAQLFLHSNSSTNGGWDIVPLPASGGGAGSGALNLINLTSSYAQTDTDDQNFESTVGNWSAYADAAGTSPVDMTAGSPNTTVTRSTSSPMNGTAHGLVTVTTGATRQGEGISKLAYIPPAYRGRSLELSFPFVTTGTIVEDDFKLYVYDVTNSVLITPYSAGKILGSSGIAKAVFPVSTNTAQIRVGIHIARTSTGAATITIDDVMLSPFTTPVGLAGSDWAAFTPTGTWSTNTTWTGYWRRVGQNLEVNARAALSGAPTGAFSINIPFGLVIDQTKLTDVNGIAPLGYGSVYDNGVALYGAWPIYNTTTNVRLWLSATSVSVDATHPVTFGNTDEVVVNFKVPIVGWSSNVSMAESSTFWISSYLANGTRVTSAPTKLGEYRSFQKDNNANTGTDTAPTVAPNVADGIPIGAFVKANPGSGNYNISKWEIFVGKNKNVDVQFYQNSGRSGSIMASMPNLFSTNNAQAGTAVMYDPVSGVVYINCIPISSSNTTNYIGWSDSDGTGNVGSPTTGYFDIKVSENALAVGTQQPRAELMFYAGAGHGATNTKVPYFTNAVNANQGNAFSYTNDSTSGTVVTILEPGVYTTTYSGAFTGASDMGVVKNSSSKTTSIGSITQSGVMCMSTTGGANATRECTATNYYNAGDVVNPQDEGTAFSGSVNSSIHRFSITKVVN